MRLWQVDATPIDAAILAFTVGDDPVLDLELLPYDCLATAAHVEMLEQVGVLSNNEQRALRAALGHAYAKALARQLPILPEQEDGHTALEAWLTATAGEAGLKVHTGRSRNDQVIMALRLLIRHRLVLLAQQTGGVVETLLHTAARHREVLMPGFTHTRYAMPSTVGQLFAAAAEGLLRDLEGFLPPLSWCHRSALGSASGYGVPLPLDRPRVAALLGLAGVDLNTLQVQNSRGKLEASVLFALYQICLTMGRLATDLIEYSSEVFGFFQLPVEVTTGSSIMPQKRNPDVLELMRAVPATLLSRLVEVGTTLHGLSSGYHRDLQRTKAPLLRGLQQTRDSLTIMAYTVQRVQVDVDRCQGAINDALCATDAVYAKVRSGVPFRTAYRQVKNEGTSRLTKGEILGARTHLGAPGTDYFDRLHHEAEEILKQFEPFAAGVAQAESLLK